MAVSGEERRAAAAARRARVLAKGDSRMAQVTGTIAQPTEYSDSGNMGTSVPSSNNSDFLFTSQPNPVDVSKSNTKQLASLPSNTTTKGTAAGQDKWAKYADIKPLPARSHKRMRPFAPMERLDYAVKSTTLLRITFALLHALVLFTATQLATVPAPNSWSLAWQRMSLTRAIAVQVRKSKATSSLMPLLKSYKQVKSLAIMEAAVYIKKNPHIARTIHILDQHAPSSLLVINISMIFSTYVFLLVGGRAGIVDYSIGEPPVPSSSSSLSSLPWRVMALLAPGLRERAVVVMTWQRLTMSIINSFFVYLVTLGCCQLLITQLQVI